MCAALQPKVSQGGKRRRDRAEVSAIVTGRVLICISEDLPEPADAGDGDLGSDMDLNSIPISLRRFGVAE